jgi:hypothetical protein
MHRHFKVDQSDASPFNLRMNRRQHILALGSASLLACQHRASALQQPKGLILSYTFEEIKDGIIRSKAGFPLHAPLAPLQTAISKRGEAYLQLLPGQSFSPPPSSLLDFYGADLVLHLRVQPQSEGLLYSQGDKENHLALYIVLGIPVVAITQMNQTIFLQGRRSIIGEWIVLSLQLTADRLSFSANRERLADLPLSEPLLLPGNGFTLGYNPLLSDQQIKARISSIKLLRQ